MDQMEPSIQVAIGGVIALIIGGLMLSDRLDQEETPTTIPLSALKMHEPAPVTFVHIEAAAVHHGYGFELVQVTDGKEVSSYYAPVISLDAADTAASAKPGDPLRGVHVIRGGGRPGIGDPTIERLPDGLRGRLSTGLTHMGQASISGEYWKLFPDSSMAAVWVLRRASAGRDLLMPILLLVGGLLALIGGIVWTRRTA